jgi:hypothetical protein
MFSAPNYCGEFDNAGAMMSVDETLMCSFQILKPARKVLGGSTNNKSGFKVYIINMKTVYMYHVVSTICCPIKMFGPFPLEMISVLNFQKHYKLIVWHASGSAHFKMI